MSPSPKGIARIAVLAAAVPFLAIAPTSAATITLETSIINTNPACNGTQSAVTSNVATGATLTGGPCTGSTGFEVPTTTAATARGSFDGSGLSLGAYASISGHASFFALGEAFFTDTVTPVGGVTGQAGFAQFVMAVDGSAFCTVGVCTNPAFDDSVRGTIGIGLGAPVAAGSGYNQPPGSTVRTLADGSSMQVLQVPIVFGTPFTFTLFLRASADMSGSAPATETADWLNTAILRQVSLVDGSSNTILTGEIVSDSGLVYPNAAVPEPASLLLIGTGLAAAARRQRNRKRGR